MLIWPEASRAQNNMATVSADGSTVCIFDPALELLVQPFDRIRRPRAAPLGRRQMCKREQPIAGFVEAVGDRAVLEPPLADESLAAHCDVFRRGRVDHVGIVGADFLMHALRRVREQIAMLVNGAALYQCAVPNDGNRAFSSPGAPSTIRNSGRRRPRPIRSSRTERKEIGSPKFWSKKALEPVLAKYNKDHPLPPQRPPPICKGQ